MKKKVKVQCVWCGQIRETIEVSVNDDIPDEVVDGYEPCKKCVKVFQDNYTLIEAEDTPLNPNQPSIHSDRPIYPTGRRLAIPEDYLANLQPPDDTITPAIGDYDFVSTEAFEDLAKQIKKANPEIMKTIDFSKTS